jgi:hypothetical protein
MWVSARIKRSEIKHEYIFIFKFDIFTTVLLVLLTFVNNHHGIFMCLIFRNWMCLMGLREVVIMLNSIQCLSMYEVHILVLHRQ